MRAQLFSLPEMIQASCSSLVTLLALQNNVLYRRILLGAGIGSKNFRLFLHKQRQTERKLSCKLPQLSILVMRMLTQAVLVPKPSSISVSILTNCSKKQNRNWRRIVAEVILFFPHAIYFLLNSFSLMLSFPLKNNSVNMYTNKIYIVISLLT